MQKNCIFFWEIRGRVCVDRPLWGVVEIQESIGMRDVLNGFVALLAVIAAIHFV